MPRSRRNPHRKRTWSEVLNRQVRKGRRPAPVWRTDLTTGLFRLPPWVSALTERLFLRSRPRKW